MEEDACVGKAKGFTAGGGGALGCEEPESVLHRSQRPHELGELAHHVIHREQRLQAVSGDLVMLSSTRKSIGGCTRTAQ